MKIYRLKNIITSASCTLLAIASLVHLAGCESSAVGSAEDSEKAGAGACMNTDTYSEHCGFCGHSCLGGACYGGRCQPVELVNDHGIVHDLAVDESRAYWIGNYQYLMSVSLRGGVPELVSMEQFSMLDIALDDANVYVLGRENALISTGTVKRFSKATGQHVALASDLYDPVGIALSGESVFFTVKGSMPGGGSVIKVGKNGGSLKPIAMGQTAPGVIAADGQSVYWINGSKAIMKCSVEGDGVAPLVNDGGDIAQTLAVDDAYVYYATASALRKVPKAGGTPIDLAPIAAGVSSLVVDEKNVYWTRAWHSPGTVFQIAKAGGAPVAAATGQVSPDNLALNSFAIFWNNYDPNISETMRIAMLAK